MPLPSDFASQCLYAEEAWFVHDLLQIDRDARSVVALVDTTRLGPLVDAQIALPGHPKHVPGAVCVQLTGTLGCIMGVYVLDMPPAEGWVGFGTHIHEAKFPGLGEIGPPMEARATVLSLRTLKGTSFVRYAFEFTQNEQVVYRSQQTAAWFRRTE